jgi:hypothetical protein
MDGVLEVDILKISKLIAEVKAHARRTPGVAVGNLRPLSGELKPTTSGPLLAVQAT